MKSKNLYYCIEISLSNLYKYLKATGRDKKVFISQLLIVSL